MAKSYEALGELENAINCYKQALEIDPDYGITYFRMGDVYMQMQKYPEAIGCFIKDIEKRPNAFVSHNNASFLLFAGGKGEESVHYFWKGVSIFPSYQQAFAHFTGGLKDFVDENNVPLVLKFLEFLMTHDKTNEEAKVLLNKVR